MEVQLLVDRLSWVVLIQRVPISQCECRDKERPTGLACRSIEMKSDCDCELNYLSFVVILNRFHFLSGTVFLLHFNLDLLYA